jgi:hypothetical protein
LPLAWLCGSWLGAAGICAHEFVPLPCAASSSAWQSIHLSIIPTHIRSKASRGDAKGDLPNQLRPHATAYEPRTRAASATGRQPPVRRTEEGQRSQPRFRSGSPATEPSGPGAKLPPPRTTPSPTQLLTGPRGRTAAKIVASGLGPSDRAAGRWPWGAAPVGLSPCGPMRPMPTPFHPMLTPC